MKIKAFVILLLFISTACRLNAQDHHPNTAFPHDYMDPPAWSWAEQFGGSAADIGRDLTSDADGNIYITGSFSGEITAGSETYNSTGKRDAFLAMYSSTGTLIWFRHFPAAGNEETLDAFGITMDNADHLYITGYYTGLLTLGSFTLPEFPFPSYFYARLDMDGNIEFASGPAFPYGYGSATNGICIRTDTSQNIYLILSNEFNHTSHYNSSSVISLDPDGSVRWDFPTSISFFDMEIYNNKIFYSGTVNDYGTLGDIILDPSYISDAFLARSDLDGNWEWAEIPGHNSYGYSYGFGLALDGNGNLYQSGFFNYNLIVGETELTGFYETFILKANQIGEYSWVNESYKNYAFQICTNSSRVFVAISENLYLYNSSSGEELGSVPSNHSPAAIFYCNPADQVISTGNKDQLVCVYSFNNSLDLNWHQSFSGNSGIGYNIGMSTDHYGYYYYFNYASNTMDYFDTQVDKGSFIAKQDLSGHVIWTRQYSNLTQDYGPGCYIVANVNTNSVYISGSFAEPFTIPDVGTLWPAQSGSYFIIKNDLDGNYLWHIQVDHMIYFNYLSTDQSGNILLSGVFDDTLTIGNQVLVSNGARDAFISKYNSEGQFQWAISGGGEDMEYFGSISTDSLDNVYYVGEFDSQNVIFDGQSITMNDGDGNIFIAKLDPQGDLVWIKVKGGTPEADYYCWPTSIITLPDGDFYVKGAHADSAHFDNFLLTNPYSNKKNYNHFIAMFDQDGNTLWAHSMNVSVMGYDYNQMDVDSEGNVYLGLEIKDSLWFENLFAYHCQNYPYSVDLFTAKYASDGTLQWVKCIPSITEVYFLNWLSCVSVYDEDQVIVGGFFKNGLDMDPYTLNSDCQHGFIADLSDVQSIYEHPEDQATFTVFPVPASKEVTVSFPRDIKGSVIFTIYDLSGKMIRQWNWAIRENQVKLDISELSQGIYIIHAENQDFSQAEKLIVY